MTTPAARLKELLAKNPPHPEEIAAYLDGLAHAQRMEAITALHGPSLQRKLYDLAAGAPKVTLDEIVSPDTTPLREVIYHGKNSLPAFTLFQKRFCRPAPGTPGHELWGYNHQTLAWLTGPGYFVCHDAPGGAEIDYRQVPPRAVPGWPPVKPNDRGLSTFVFKNMVDLLRRVSKHVLIGSATRSGKDMGSYFVLCRE